MKLNFLGKFLKTNERLLCCTSLQQHKIFYRIARNFWGRKLSRISRFVTICGSFSTKFGGRGILWCSKSKQSAKVFSAKIVFFTNLWKISPSKVSRYTVSLVRYPHLFWAGLAQNVWLHCCKKICASTRNLTWFTRSFSSWEGGVWARH